MKRAFIILALACAPLAAGCASIPASPGELANVTVLDEQAASGVELAYKAWRLAIETAIDAGLLRGERAARVAAADNRAYGALRAVRSAYAAGNAADYLAATGEARDALNAGIAALKGEQP